MTPWLPALLTLEEHGSDSGIYLEAVYAAFKKDFVDTKASFRLREVGIKRYPKSDGKERCFWHLISEGADEANRAPQISRCQRIRWPRAIIDRESEPQVKVWYNERKGEGRILLLLEPDDYLVVLAERKTYLLLWTAYPLDYPNRKARLLREYEDFRRKAGAAP